MNHPSTSSSSRSEFSRSTEVPDILLSIAKDNRYIQQLTYLCNQVILPYLPDSFSYLVQTQQQEQQNHGNRESLSSSSSSSPLTLSSLNINTIQPELSLLARILFFGSIFSSSLRKSESSSSIQNDNGRGGKNIMYKTIGQEYLHLHLNGVVVDDDDYSSKIRLYTYIILATFSPYIMERIGNMDRSNFNGWDDVKVFMKQWILFLKRNVRKYFDLLLGLSSTSASTLSYADNQIRNYTRTNSSNITQTVFENDRLRGIERREAFEAMRRRMIERAHDHQDLRINSHNNEINEDSTLSQDQSSGIMNVCQNHFSPQSQEPPDHQQQTGSRLRQYVSVLYMIALRRKCISLIKHIHEATKRLQQCPTAHELESRGTTIHDDGTNHNINEYIVSMIKWFMRLNIALFYANRKYPSVLHRLTGIEIVNASKLITTERPSYKPVYFMILLQSCAQLVNGVGATSLNYWETQRLRQHRSRRIQQRQRGDSYQSDCTSDYNHEDEDNDVDEFQRRIECCVPSINSISTHCPVFNIQRRSNRTRAIALCGICMNDLSYPSALRSCGHVFCWNCVQHWIVTVRPECPLCRVATSSKDVICLYEYSPY